MLYIDISWTIIYVQEPNIDALSAAKIPINDDPLK